MARSKRMFIMGAALAVVAGSLAACTSDQEAAALGGVQIACALGPVAVGIATANVGIISMANQASSACGTFIPQVANVIKSVTGAGQQATVTVTGAALPKMKFSARRVAGGVEMRRVGSIKPQVFVIPADPFPGFD